MPEIIRPLQPIRLPRIAVIDFDGTLSLIRSGWVEIMLAIMTDVLKPLPGTTESDEELTAFIMDFAMNLNGRPTVFQMDVLVNTAKQRAGNPESPEYYTRKFLETLVAKAEQRIVALKSGKADPDDLLVPGARTMLTDLRSRGVQLSLASGTAGIDVQREAEVLQIAHFFDGRIFGPGEKSREFSKIAVMRQLLADANADGSELLGIGDGFIETQNAKELRGIAIGCASDETHRSGKMEDWKRTRLINAGADIIVPDFQQWHEISKLLFPS